MGCNRLGKNKGVISPWLEPLFWNFSVEGKVSRKQVPPRREEQESAHKPQKDLQTEVLRRMEGEMDIQQQGNIVLELQQSHCKTQTT